jgi:hypothetical protein
MWSEGTIFDPNKEAGGSVKQKSKLITGFLCTTGSNNYAPTQNKNHLMAWSSAASCQKHHSLDFLIRESNQKSIVVLSIIDIYFDPGPACRRLERWFDETLHFPLMTVDHDSIPCWDGSSPSSEDILLDLRIAYCPITRAEIRNRWSPGDRC